MIDNLRTDIGILGGGQLARMLLQAATSLGLDVCIMESVADSPAGRLTDHEIVGTWDNDDQLRRFAATTSVALLESEFVPAPRVALLESLGVRVVPGSAALATVQDKFLQKSKLAEAGLAVPSFRAVESATDIVAAGNEWGWPVVLKRRSNGYDGYGNQTVHSAAEVAHAIEQLGRSPGASAGQALMVEKHVPFERELAVMVVRRSVMGDSYPDSAIYPIVETIQKNHICHEVYAPVELNSDLTLQASQMAMRAIEALDLYGVAGVELFQTAGGLMINEIAPRVHNSGHYTIDACATSQFENAVRAALGWPLGVTAMSAPIAAMVNLLGSAQSPVKEVDGIVELLAVPGAHLHLYGKRQSRPGRKMGHVTTIGDDPIEVLNRARRAAQAISM